MNKNRAIVGVTILVLVIIAAAKRPARLPVESNIFEKHESGFISFCEASRRPCGILIDASQPFDPPAKPAWISGADTKQVMDAYLQAVPAYRWEDADGTLVITPRSLPRNVAAKLYGTPVTARFDALPSDEAAMKVLEIANIPWTLFTGGAPGPYGKITAAFNGDSAASALNAIAKKDGLMMWVLGYYPGWIHTRYSFDMPSWREPDDLPKKASARSSR